MLAPLQRGGAILARGDDLLDVEHGVPPQEFERRQRFERPEHLGEALLLLQPGLLA